MQNDKQNKSIDETVGYVSTQTTSASGETTTTIDPTMMNDSTAAIDNETSVRTDKNFKTKFQDWDIIIVIGIIFNFLVWSIIIASAYIIIKPLFSVISEFTASIKNASSENIFTLLFFGIISSVLATVVVLITRLSFYRIRNWLPAKALFRGLIDNVNPCLVFLLRMKDPDQTGRFIAPYPEYSPIKNNKQFLDLQNIPWVNATFDALGLSLVFNVLGQAGITKNIEVVFPDKDYDRWDSPMILIGGHWKTRRSLEICDSYFCFNDKGFILLPSNKIFVPTSKEEDIGLLQKIINPTNRYPIWVLMGWRGGGTTAAAYSLVRWWKYLGILYGHRPFGLLVAFNDKDGWQQSHIISLYPKPKWYTILKHPFTWRKLKVVMKKPNEALKPT